MYNLAAELAASVSQCMGLLLAQSVAGVDVSLSID